MELHYTPGGLLANFFILQKSFFSLFFALPTAFLRQQRCCPGKSGDIAKRSSSATAVLDKKIWIKKYSSVDFVLIWCYINSS